MAVSDSCVNVFSPLSFMTLPPQKRRRKKLTCDTWHLTRDMWHVTCDTWDVTCDTWHMTCDMWHVVRGEHSLKILTSWPLLFVFLRTNFRQSLIFKIRQKSTTESILVLTGCTLSFEISWLNLDYQIKTLHIEAIPRYIRDS